MTYKQLILCLLFSLPGLRAEDDSSYVLQPNDVVKLEVYQEPELTSQVRILKTGEASFPLIGSLQVSGLSVTAATSKVRELYAKDFIVDPKVTLMVDEYAAQYISVVGAVKAPGQIPIPVSGNLDLATAMATAGGLAEDANVNNITLVRTSGGTSSFSISDIVNGASGRIKLFSGDRIIANQSSFVGKTVNVLGQVSKTGPVTFPVDGKLDLVKAIALAGGLTELANPRKITINRKGTITVVDYKEVSQRGDRPLLLDPDDVVTVAERLF